MVSGYYPNTLLDALIIRKENPGALLVGGGSDIMVIKKKAEQTIFLNGISELKMTAETDDTLRIGAGVTYAGLLASGKIPEVLKQAVRKIASPAIRNVGTMAGNICNASPAGDTLPVLYAMDAVVVTASLEEGTKIHEERTPISQFILGVRKIALESDKIVTAVEIPCSSYRCMEAYYQKVGAREAEAISKLSFAGLYQIKEDIITDFRVAFGSVGATVVRAKDLEQKVNGLNKKELTDCYIEDVVKDYENILHPIDDQRSTAIYRKKVCLNLLRDFLAVIGGQICQ